MTAVFTVVRRMRRRPRCMNMIMMDRRLRWANATLAKHAGHEKRYVHRPQTVVQYFNILNRNNIMKITAGIFFIL